MIAPGPGLPDPAPAPAAPAPAAAILPATARLPALEAAPKAAPAPWFGVGLVLDPRRRPPLLALSFLLPLLLWSAASYCPWIWHPLVLVTDPGDAAVAGAHDYLAKDMLVEKDVFAARNGELAAAGKAPARGEPRNPIYLPAPHEVARALVTAFRTPPQLTGEQWLHQALGHSFRVIFWGFFWSALFGVPLGILCGSLEAVARICEPFIDFVRYMPAPVFGALAVAILGLDDGPKVTVIFIGTFFQMVLVVANTARRLEACLLEAARTLGARGRQLLFHVVVPGILPDLYRDMRILLGWAWTYLVVAELIGVKSGISAFLYQAQRYKQFDNVYAGILIIGLVGLATDQALALLGRRLFPWREGSAPRRAKAPATALAGAE